MNVSTAIRGGEGITAALHYVVGNPRLAAGVLLLSGLLTFSLAGYAFYDTELAFPLSAPIAQEPSFDHPFGTDASGRDLLAVMIAGTLLTMKVGLIAGALGVVIGTVLAFIAAYYGGWADRIISGVVDVLLTVPGLLVLIVLASSIPGQLNTTSMAFVIAALAWREPTRQIRAQALVMREATYVQMARLSGRRNLSIIFMEMMPNLLPYLGASLVAAVSGAVLSSVGLEALGLGSRHEPTLGMTIYWMMLEGAFVRGLWWWVLEPIVVLVTLFVGLYLLSIGLDEFANPRLRGVS
jgi:peptide/nickel transport system permease protein